MTDTITDAAFDAISMLDAFGYSLDSVGDTTEWAYFSQDDQKLHLVGAGDLDTLGVAVVEDPANGYSLWCADCGCVMEDDDARDFMAAAGTAGDDDVVEMCRAHLGR